MVSLRSLFFPKFRQKKKKLRIFEVLALLFKHKQVLTLYLRKFYVFIFNLQLLSQLDNHGPPPADRETIENLPTISVTAEHVGKFSLPSFSPNILFFLVFLNL